MPCDAKINRQIQKAKDKAKAKENANLKRPTLILKGIEPINAIIPSIRVYNASQDTPLFFYPIKLNQLKILFVKDKYCHKKHMKLAFFPKMSKVTGFIGHIQNLGLTSFSSNKSPVVRSNQIPLKGKIKRQIQIPKSISFP